MNLYTHQPNLKTRWACCENPLGKKGGACRNDDGRKRFPCKAPLAPGEHFIMAKASGTSGCVRRIWITIKERNLHMMRGLRLQIFWDHAPAPAVDVPLGDFFCQMNGRNVPFENALFSSPEGRSYCCNVPMPFKESMEISVTNETDEPVRFFFYEVDYTIGDKWEKDTLYFHSHWRCEAPTTLLKDYEILPGINGKGRYLGATIGVKADTETYVKSWWGEGEVKMFLDGDTDYPTLCGTGTEDYIGTGWGQGSYSNLYQGCPLADAEQFHYGFYRLHIPDPIFYNESIRVTIQQIGCALKDVTAQMHGLGRKLIRGDDPLDLADEIMANRTILFERQDTWSSCAWYYLNTPESNLPALMDVSQRIQG